jgi:cyclohexanecarboxylate-CoA ligase
MEPTFLPPARRAHHEAAGEWPSPSFSEVLATRACADARRPYIIEARRDGSRMHTFAAVHALANQMAAGLRGVGVGPGDVVSWQLPNWVEAVALAAAIDRIGAISSPIITIYREHEVAFVCRHTRSKVLVVPGLVRGYDYREMAGAVQAQCPDLELVLTVRATPAAGQRALEDLEPGRDTAVFPVRRDPHQVSMVFYTSGTTSDPKAVLHTPATVGGLVGVHRRIFSPTPDDRGLMQFPFPHIGGVIMFGLVPVVHGSSVVLVDGFDPAWALDLIEEFQVTSAGGPPAVLQAMFRAPNFSAAKVRSVRTSGSGAADVSPDLMRETKAKFGAFAYRSYGLTECPMFTSGRPGDPDDKLHGTDGRPSPGCTARLVGEDGRPVGLGAEGEIEAFGPQLCVGYLDPALNVAFTKDGYFRTGDLGVMDAEGFVRITGRRKDIIIRKGENLSAKGIEDMLASHPQIGDVAVIGVPDPESGERVCACVVPRAGGGAPSLALVREFMQAQGVMMQKIPEQLEVLTELPRNAVGKVRKDLLRARFRS